MATAMCGAVSFAGAARANSPGACPPSVRLAGNIDLVAEAHARLQERSIIVASAPAPFAPCGPITRAWLERSDDGVVVDIQDPDGRRVVRKVATASTAATLIETWTHAELGSAVPVEDGAPPPKETATGVAVAAAAAGSPAVPRGALTAGVGPSWATDGTAWYGLHAAGCVRIGRACVGALMRADRQWGETARTRAATATSRYGAELLLLGEASFDLGKLSIQPGVGLGFGWLRSAGEAVEVDADTGEVEHHKEAADSGGIRGALRLALGRQFGTHMAAALLVEGGFAPFARTAPRREEDVSLAAEPRALLRAALALRWSAP